MVDFYLKMIQTVIKYAHFIIIMMKIKINIFVQKI